MKVHVAMGGWNGTKEKPEGFEQPFGVYSTPELAQAAIDKRLAECKYDYVAISEYEIDEEPR